jgi:hypothetical protein
MYKKYCSSIMIILLLSVSLTAWADVASAIPKDKVPVECTDSENYDQADCQRALDMIQWKNNQDKLPDDQRKTNAGLGENLLIEKITGYRIGPHRIRVAGHQKDGIAIKIGTSNDTKMFLVSGVCDIGNSINVVKNTPNFTLFYAECDSTNRRGNVDNSFDYYSFDKQSKRLVMLLQGEGRSGGKEPTQTFDNGLYKFLWRNYQTLDNGKYFSVYYDYKISDTTESGVKCTRVWDKDAGCDIETVPALVPGKYKILD